MVAKRSTTMGKIKPYVDVRSQKDVPQFESLFKMGPVIVLVYADWCGHCRTFKNEMWDEAVQSTNRTRNVAAVHYNMVDKTSMQNAKIQGYPTLFEVKPTPKTNVSKPVATPQNKEELNTLLGTMPPNNNVQMENNTNMNTGANEVQANLSTIPQTLQTNQNTMRTTQLSNNVEISENNRRSNNVMRNATNASEATFTPEPLSTLPPDMEEDIEESPKTQVTPSIGGGNYQGGSLMETLLKISADAAHAVVLTGSAMEISRRLKKRKSQKRHRSLKKKQTRRR